MFSDPLPVKLADVITSAGAASDLAWVGGNANEYRDYRAEGSDVNSEWVNTIRSAVYPNAGNTRYVMSGRSV